MIRQPAPPNLETPIRHQIAEQVQQLDARTDSTISLYLDVHAQEDPSAPLQRANAILRTLPIGRKSRERVERLLEEELRNAREGHLAWFASEDGATRHASLLLEPEIPLPGNERDVAGRYGEPWTTPLKLLLASTSPVVVVFADARRARLFVYDLGELDEVAAYVRALDPTVWRRYAEHATGTPGSPARGGSGRDDFEARKEAWSERFLRTVVDQICISLAQEPSMRLALLGDTARTAHLEHQLPQHLRGRLLLRGSMPVDPDLPVEQLRDPLRQAIEDVRASEDTTTAEKAVRDGATGLADVLRALADGTVADLVVPADSDVDVVHCLGTSWVAPNEMEARHVCPEGPIEHAPFKAFLLDLATRSASRVHIVHGDAAHLLRAHGAEVAGILRRQHA